MWKLREDQVHVLQTRELMAIASKSSWTFIKYCKEMPGEICDLIYLLMYINDLGAMAVSSVF